MLSGRRDIDITIQKSRVKYEIKYNLYLIAQQTLKLGLLMFRFFSAQFSSPAQLEFSDIA